MYTVTVFQVMNKTRREVKVFFSEDYDGSLEKTVQAAEGWRDMHLPCASIDVRLIPGI